MVVIDDDNYYLAIGRDAASTIESLGVDDKVAEWIKDLDLPADIDGECRSVFSYRRASATNEDMLDYVYGNKRTVRNRRRFSTPIGNIGDSHKRSNPFVIQNQSILEENIAIPLETLSSQEHSAWSSANAEEVHANVPTLHFPLPSQSEQGQYVDYHTAVKSIDSSHDSVSSQKKDFTSATADSDSVFIDSSSVGNYIDHSIAAGATDSAYHSLNTGVGEGRHHLESLSITSLVDEQDTSSTYDQYATPTTGVYQSHNIAVIHDDADCV